jgi:hypothetical protein
MSDFNEILNALNNANKKLEKQVYIPSLKKEVLARPLNAHHTKSLIKTAIDGPFASNQFNMEIRNILKNILDVDLSTVTIYDKPIILLQLREHNISPELSVTIPDTNVESKINIEEHLKKFKKEKNVEDVTVERDGIVGTLNYPSIETEFQFDNFLFQSQISKINRNDMDQMKSIIAPIFMSSLVMFLSTLTIGDSVIDMATLSSSERLRIADNLPSSFLTDVIAKIDECFGKNIQKILTVNTTHEDKNYSINIELDASLFLK